MPNIKRNKVPQNDILVVENSSLSRVLYVLKDLLIKQLGSFLEHIT